MSGIIVAALITVSSFSGCWTQNNRCGTFSVGETECVLFSAHYNDYQWATCLTDEYIRRVSNGDHHCRDRAATVCWYQCQLEINGEAQGQVSDNCRCSNTDLSTTPAQAAPTLSPDCVSPGTLHCNWYRDCLEVRYPCRGTEDGYAIEYAQKYCNLFSDNYNDFSPTGRQWVDAVRNCLQKGLIPTLRPWEVNTCADIKNRAFDSHSGCYLNPAPGAPSICNIPCKDAFKAFWIVNRWKDSAIRTAPIETGVQMMEILLGCSTVIRGCAGILSRTIIMRIPPTLTISLYTGLKIAQYISRNFNFDINNIGWFPFFNQEISSDNNRQRRNVEASQVNSISIVLVDLQLLGISNGTSPPARSPDSHILEDTVTAIGDAVSNGKLSQIPVEVNGTEVVLGVTSLGQCGDTLCKNSTDVVSLAVAPQAKGSALKVRMQYESTIILLAAFTSFLLRML